MANTHFQFKQFIVHQDKSAMKVTTDSCLFGAWAGERVRSQESRVGRVVDIGAGTGLLSLMFAQKHPEVIIDAIEIDNESFRQASENIAVSPWADRIKPVHADAREYHFLHKYDIIISNPPFYDRELKGDDTRKNIARHDEGLLLPELLKIIKSKLEPEGSFYLLLPYKRNEETKQLLTEHELDVQQITLVRQTTKHDYFRIMLSGTLKTKELTETIIDEIAIKDQTDKYTAAFTHLLKDYYLHL
ncbi:MAG: methyltransferase [Chitinophagaceae bacterium]